MDDRMNRQRVLLCAAATATMFPAAADAALELVRVNSNPADAGLEANYASSLGFATEAGLDCNVQFVANGAAAVTAVIAGSTEIGFGNLLSVLVAREKGFPLTIIAAGAMFSSKRPVSQLMVPIDSAIRTARDLNGHTIAIPTLMDLSQFGPMAWMDKNGGDSKTVRFVEIPFPAIPAALAAHRIDAAVVTEPFASIARASSRSLVSAFDAIGQQFLISGYFSTPAWATAHPEIARKFAAMIYRTAAFANANPARTGDLLMKITRMEPEQLRVSPRAIFAERPDPAMIQPLIDVAVKYGALGSAPAPASLFAPEALR
jgi:NitT/TauT family transport system substrate-binding protein